MAIMDLVGTLSEHEWTSMFLAESKFLQRLLTKYANNSDTYGFITKNLITLGAFVFSQNPSSFNAITNKDYVGFLKQYFSSKVPSDNEAACTCLFFLFKRKPEVTEFFV